MSDDDRMIDLVPGLSLEFQMAMAFAVIELGGPEWLEKAIRDDDSTAVDQIMSRMPREMMPDDYNPEDVPADSHTIVQGSDEMDSHSMTPNGRPMCTPTPRNSVMPTPRLPSIRNSEMPTTRRSTSGARLPVKSTPYPTPIMSVASTPLLGSPVGTKAVIHKNGSSTGICQDDDDDFVPETPPPSARRIPVAITKRFSSSSGDSGKKSVAINNKNLPVEQESKDNLVNVAVAVIHRQNTLELQQSLPSQPLSQASTLGSAADSQRLFDLNATMFPEPTTDNEQSQPLTDSMEFSEMFAVPHPHVTTPVSIAVPVINRKSIPREFPTDSTSMPQLEKMPSYILTRKEGSVGTDGAILRRISSSGSTSSASKEKRDRSRLDISIQQNIAKNTTFLEPNLSRIGNGDNTVAIDSRFFPHTFMDESDTWLDRLEQNQRPSNPLSSIRSSEVRDSLGNTIRDDSPARVSHRAKHMEESFVNTTMNDSMATTQMDVAMASCITLTRKGRKTSAAFWKEVLEKQDYWFERMKSGIFSRPSAVSHAMQTWQILTDAYCVMVPRPAEHQSAMEAVTVNAIKVYEVLTTNGCEEVASLMIEFVHKVLHRFVNVPAVMSDTCLTWIQARAALHLILSQATNPDILMSMTVAVSDVTTKFVDMWSTGDQVDEERDLSFVAYTIRQLTDLSSRIGQRLQHVQNVEQHGLLF